MQLEKALKQIADPTANWGKNNKKNMTKQFI